MRVGFLFNHDQIHQVAHSLPIALTLAEMDSDIRVIVATTNDRLRQEAHRIDAEWGVPPVQFVDLRPSTMSSRGAVKLLDRLLPVAKLTVYRDHLPFFASLDALVVAEKTSAILKTRYGLSKLKLIHTRHGAGDRAIGFDCASARFDQVLISGPKIRDRLIEEAKVARESLSMVGYPKFDLIPQITPRLSFQANGRPTVLYNPHVSPHLSSWYQHGRAVLDFFVEHPEYNLIFAPHVMLFERPLTFTIDKMRIDRPGTLDAKYWRAPNIHIDLGSSASTDMTYTLAADLYLGDVSSQVYEFLVRPRPCIFLNSHGVSFESDRNYAHWQAGQVIDRPSQLGAAMTRAWDRQPGFRPIQDRLFKHSFDLTETPSSIRAARAIAAFLDQTLPGGKARSTPLPMRPSVPRRGAA